MVTVDFPLSIQKGVHTLWTSDMPNILERDRGCVWARVGAKLGGSVPTEPLRFSGTPRAQGPFTEWLGRFRPNKIGRGAGRGATTLQLKENTCWEVLCPGFLPGGQKQSI